MSFFTSFQELLDFDHSTNLNGFHFSNSLFGFDSNSLPTLENLPPPVPASAIPNTPTSLDHPGAAAAQPPPPPSPIPSPLLETPTKLVPLTPAGPQLSPEVALQQQHHHYNHHVPQQQSPVATPLLPIVSKFQLKVTPNNEIYISNESGTFCELAGSFVPSSPLRGSPELVLEEEEEEPVVPEPPKTLYCIERGGIKRPLSPSDRRYCNSGIFRSCGIDPVRGSPNKKKSTSSAADGHGPTEPEGAKLVVSNVINNGLIVNKKHLSTTQEAPAAGHQQPSVTPERRIMRPKKRKKKIPPKGAVVTLEAKLEPIQNGTRIVTKIAPKPKVAPVAPPQATPSDSNLNFSGIKEKAAQEAIFSERVEKAPIPEVPAAVKKNGLNGIVPPSVTTVGVVEAAKEISNISGKKDGAVAEVQEIKVGEGVAATSPSSPAPVELKVVADLVMDKEVFGHVSLLNNSSDRSKTVIYQNPVTSRNVIYSILNPKSLNLALAGVDRSTTATLTLQPHRPGVRKPKKRGRKPKSAMVENPVEVEGATPAAPEPVDPNVPVMVTRSGRLSKPPRYANNFFQNMKQSAVVTPPQQLPPPPPPPPLPPPILPDPETAEKLPNFSAALSSAVVGEPAAAAIEQVQKRKMTVPLQYRCATCNKIYLGKRMQRHLQKYPSHNSARDCAGSGGGGGVTAEGGVGSEVAVKKDKEEKSTYLYKHLFDLLQRFTEKDKGRIMLKEISNFVDFVRALIPRLITNDEQNSTVEYIDHNVADVLRLNHGKYRLKLSSLAEEYEKLNLTVNLLEDEPPHSNSQNTSLPITSTPNADRQSGFSFNADDLLNQSSSFPSLTTLMHEHHVLNTMLAPAPAPATTTNNNHYLYNNNVPHQQQQQQQQQQPLHHSYTPHNLHHHHHHLPLIPEADGGVTPLAGLCKSPVQHHHHHHHVGAASAGMVNMALNLY